MQLRFSPAPGQVAFLTILFSLGLVAQTDRDSEGQKSPLAATAQVRFPRPETKKDPDGLKSLLGQVVDKEGRGLAQAIVHLKNKRNLEVKTHISDDEGNYRFRGLNPNVDYEVHAEFQGRSSRKRSVSSFDSRKEVYLVLEIDTSQ